MSTDPETTRIVRSWLMTDEHESATHVVEGALAEIDAIPQRPSTPWSARRTPIMNKILGFGLAAAAVVAVVLIGSQVIGSNTGGLGADPTPTATAEATQQPTPTPPAEGGLPQGPFVVSSADDPVQITVDIASSGWVPLPEFDAMSKDDDGLDPPETVSAALLALAYPAGAGFNVYGDPCRWTTTIPETPASTVDEIASDLAAQASRDATAPVDVTVGGYAGKAITLHTPMSFYLSEDANREDEFADCDNNTFAQWGLEEDETVEWRNAQGPGQIDQLWILDVDGSIVILDAMYGPEAPADLVEEMRTLAESATFAAP